MADKKITELNLHTSLILSDIIPIVNNSETKKTTYGSLYYGIREGVVSGSSQINISDTTGFTEFSSSIAQETPGWARYDDTQYTTSSVFSLTTVAGDQTLPNNGGNTIETHLHSTISFYNSGSQKIQVENVGDVYICTVVFRAKTSNANGTSIRLQLDSTGTTPYERVGKDLFFGKGNDVWHDFHEVFQWYGDDDFLTNGNRFKVRAVGHGVDIANVIFFIQRTQKHLV